MDARSRLKLKRGYRLIESRLHDALDVSLDEDRSGMRQPNAALVLGLFWQYASHIGGPTSACGLTGAHA